MAEPWCGCEIGLYIRGGGCARTSARMPRWPTGADIVGGYMLPSGGTRKDWSKSIPLDDFGRPLVPVEKCPTFY